MVNQVILSPDQVCIRIGGQAISQLACLHVRIILLKAILQDTDYHFNSQFEFRSPCSPPTTKHSTSATYVTFETDCPLSVTLPFAGSDVTPRRVMVDSFCLISNNPETVELRHDCPDATKVRHV